MPYLTPVTAITGDFITAADGNRRRDNDEYFKGRAGVISLENSVAIAGGLATTAGASITGRQSLHNGADGAAGLWFTHLGAQRVFFGLDDGAEDWVRVYGVGAGNILRVNRTNGAMDWQDSANDRDVGIPPRRLRRVTRVGMLGAGGGTQSFNYNGDGTIDWIHFPDGINAVSTLTFEYSAGKVVAIRLRDGGSTGTILNSVGFGYDGTGRVNAIGQS